MNHDIFQFNRIGDRTVTQVQILPFDNEPWKIEIAQNYAYDEIVELLLAAGAVDEEDEPDFGDEDE